MGLKQPTIWLITLIITAVVTYAAYSPGFGAGWTYDDTSYLKHLANVRDFDTAMVYLVRDKSISITDRPISMASFLLNIRDWPDNPSGFRQINVLLHILNGLLVAAVVRLIARRIPKLSSSYNGFAVAVAAIWMLHPFLASTSFHVIQRMVLLAATFSLIGVIMYLHGRGQLAKSNRDGYAWMTAGMLVSGGLGTLAKENAALVPLLIAVLEYTVLCRYTPISDRFLRLWKIIFFVFPAFLLLAYGIHYITSSAPNLYLIRSFTLSDRIFSESIILFEYVRQILLPDVTQMGPFQDDMWRIRSAGVITWLAVAIWVVLIGLAIFWRRKFPALSFSI